MAKKQRRTVRTPAGKRPTRKPTRPAPRKAKGKAKAKSGATGESAKQRALATLIFAHKSLMDMVADWPADKVTYQSVPTDNHALWTIGHLVSSYSWFGSALGVAVPKPDNYDALFGFGSKPTPDASAYPSFDSVKAACAAAFDAVVAGFETQSDHALAGACAIDTHGFARDRIDVIEKAAWHEGWHAGQLSSLRRALGLKPMMG